MQTLYTCTNTAQTDILINTDYTVYVWADSYFLYTSSELHIDIECGSKLLKEKATEMERNSQRKM